jgi:hypothetical protein
MLDIGRFLIVEGLSCRKKEQQPCQPACRSVNSPGIAHLYHFAEWLRFFLILAMLETSASEQGIERGKPEREARLAIFIALKRPGPPAREVLVNLDNILMVQPGQGSGSAILFGREHLVSVEEDVATVLRRIQTGPYIRTDQA